MKIDATDFIKQVNDSFIALEKESVTVGILDDSVAAAVPDYKQTRNLPSDSGNMIVVRPKRGKRSKTTLKELAGYLDSTTGFSIFSDPEVRGNNRFARQVAEQFANLNKSATDIKRLENACRAMIRNPIYERQYAAKYGLAYGKKKGNTPYGISTGRFFSNIKARFAKR